METQTQKQNLLNQVSSVTITRPPGYYKSIVLDALTVLAALGFGWVFQGYTTGAFGSIALLASAALFLTLNLLSTLFTEWFGRRAFVLALECVGLVAAFFAREGANAVWGALGIIVPFLFWGEFSARMELRNGARIRFFRIARQNFSKLATGIIFAYLVLYYPYLDRENALVPRAAFQGVFQWSGGVIQQFYRDVDLGAPIRDVARKIFEIKLNQDPSYRALPPPDREKVIAEQADAFIASIGASLGYAVDAEKTLEEIVYEVLTRTLNNLQGKFGSLFFAGWVVTIFLVVRSLGTLFYLLVGGVAFLVYQMLLALTFVQIVNEPRSQEVITY